jgi:hypothetical protein
MMEREDLNKYCVGKIIESIFYDEWGPDCVTIHFTDKSHITFDTYIGLLGFEKRIGG